MTSVSEVFGLNRAKNPLSYVVRPIEKTFHDSLDDDGVVLLVVYGMSKQGKSSLLRSALAGRPHIFLQANRGVNCEAVYTEMLSQCGIEQETSNSSSAGGKASASLAGWFKISVDASGTRTKTPVNINIANPDSVSRVLSESRTDRRIIVVDNFHYFDDGVQREFATAIRSFETYGFKMIVIGTWSEAGYLTNFNRDIAATSREFSFDEWSFAELQSVLAKGGPDLKVTLSYPVQQSLIHRSVNNVALLQELTRQYLTGCGITTDAKAVTLSDVSKVVDVANEMESRLENDAKRALRFIASIGENNPYLDGKSRSWWILKAFLASRPDLIMAGVPAADLLTDANELAQQRAAQLKLQFEPISEKDFMGLIKHHWHKEQVRELRTPIVLFNDQTKRLVIVDAWVKFVLRGARRNYIRNDL